MTIDKMKSLKEGDIVVHVRKNYQNYDHTKVPCEPKVYTIYSKSMDIYLKEVVKKSFIKDGRRCVSAMGCSKSIFCACFETLEDYLSGDYEKDIVLDKTKWKSLEEFLMYKLDNDHKLAREAEDERVAKEDKLLKRA